MKVSCVEHITLFLACSYKESACNAGDTLSLGQEDPLEEVMATHSNILARKIP